MPLRPAHQLEPTSRVLLIDGDTTARRRLADALSGSLSARAQVSEAVSGRAAVELLRASRFDVVLFDLGSIGDLADRVDAAVGRLVRVATGALLMALSDGSSVSAAVAAMQAGAHECVSRPLDLRTILRRLDELARRHGKAPAARFDHAIAELAAEGNPIVAVSSQMQVVDEQLTRAAASQAPVFLTGEIGVGKALCAEILHSRGPRSGRRFVTVNCAALAPADAAADVFGAGHGKGAAELANGGTLFFDEIAELEAAAQTQLLKLLQTGAVGTPGETGRPVDVRVICATSRNPAELMAERRLREDLFYRLHVLPIHVPPLRQRPADVPELARLFLQRYAREERKSFTGFSAGAEQLLAARDWPGNARQLQAFVQRLVVMCDGGELGAAALAMAGLDTIGVAAAAPSPAANSDVRPMWQEEQRIIETAVARFGGNIAMAAAALELSPSTIYRKRQAWAELNAKGAA